MAILIELSIFAVLLASLGQVSVTIPLLFEKRTKTPSVIPLIGFLIACSASASLPALMSFWPEVALYGLAIVLPSFLIQPPLLWMYIDAITSASPWQLSKRQLLHFIPMLFGLLASIFLLTLPEATLTEIFIEDKDPPSTWAFIVVIYAFVLMLFWVVFSAAYLIMIVRRITKYRHLIRQLFANNECKELGWLCWFVSILGGTWFIALLFFAQSIGVLNLSLPVIVLAGVYGTLNWTLCVWGMRQKPGFEDRYFTSDDGKPLTPEILLEEKNKYQKSALSSDQQQTIATKLEQLMSQELVFLDNGLTLKKLAGKLSIPHHYLSQTLNDHLGQSFFEYINRIRIEYSLPSVLENKTPILDIALSAGFNARSSFYSSFKQVTGKTPSDFRKMKKHQELSTK